MTDVYGILGHPVGHSRSPAMHNRAFAVLGIDAVYVPFSVAPERLETALRGVRALELRGVNVTLPHKSAIIPLLDEIEADARAIGAVNTVYRSGTKLCGTNSDAAGLTRALAEASVPLTAAKVTVLGAGGAARACVVGLARAGAAQIAVAARQESKARALTSELEMVLPQTALSVCEWQELPLTAALAESDLLVQATSATLGDGEGAEAFARSLPLSALPAHASVVDIVYSPLDTSVLRLSRERGLRTIDGLGMLLHQAVISFELWTGQVAPIDEMRTALSTSS
ncbi:MAG TPA: shikimate dehydrogenase [Polyangiales bacterium]